MRRALVIFVLLGLTVASARAQGGNPWAATLTLSRTPVATGECTVAYINLTDATSREWPRGPTGARVAMSDFDLAVSTPTAHTAVGVYDGSNSYRVCACPKAPAGAVATVTATYPSKWIAARARATGVAFAISTSVPIVAGTSSGNPPGCDASVETTVAARGGARPWSVALQPPATLSIGSCRAVSMTLRDSTGKEWPRNPAGARLSFADFDMTVQAANGADVVGKWDGSNNFSACACQSGTVGERATVTATYPAKALPDKARVPGMALTASAPLTLATAVGTANPAGCGAQQPIVAIGGPVLTRSRSGATPVGGASKADVGESTGASKDGEYATKAAGEKGDSKGESGDVRSDKAGEYASKAAGESGDSKGETKAVGEDKDGEYATKAAGESGESKDSPSAGDNATKGNPASVSRGASVVRAPVELQAPAAGARKSSAAAQSRSAAVPMGVALAATPVVAHLSWQGRPKATRYVVIRQDGSGNSVTLTPSTATALQLQDAVPNPAEVYRYTVVAYYAKGVKADSAPIVQFTSPPLVNPSKLSATDAGNGVVKLEWVAVSGAARYRVDGTGISSSGLSTSATSITVSQVPTGPGSWKVTAIYPGNFADYTSATVTGTTVSGTARPGKP